MEAEFDKEMDALLRKAAGRGVLVGDDTRSHLDADTIAAFAENALPVKSRTIYTQHLAACDPCRISLANLISMNAAAEPVMAAAAAPIPAASVPWYRKVFQAPNLAYVMGGLVLIFGGLFGFFVLQNAFNGGEATLSSVQDSPAPQMAPARAEVANSTAVVNTNTNSASNVVGEIPQSVGVADQPLTDLDDAAAAQPPVVTADSSSAGFSPAKPVSIDGLDVGKDKAVAAAPPAPKEAKREEDEKAKNEVKLAAEQELRKQDNSVNLYSNQQNQTQMAPGAGNKPVGPNRADVQRDNRELNARQMNELPVQGRTADSGVSAAAKSKASSIRNAGGKKFELKQGAWYDTAYSGQATTNVQRSSEEFRKLDSGLRNIANSISGTVVVVWKGKAYRIQ